jgi:trehalose 6-phosphate phosphatase
VRLRRPPSLSASCALFLDLDGTLFDLAPSPDRVRPDPSVLALLPALGHLLGGAVAMITGRTIADADRLFPGRALPMAGQHGFERRGADGAMHRHVVPTDRLDRMRHAIGRFAAHHPGLLLEDKGLTLALHYRLAPRLAPQVHRLLHALVAETGGEWTLQKGHRVLEVKPAGRDKGSAILDFMAEAPFRGRVPVVAGDDLTDEYGFAEVKAQGGWAVKVGPGSTCADFRLPGVAAVRQWLAASVAAPPSAAAEH